MHENGQCQQIMTNIFRLLKSFMYAWDYIVEMGCLVSCVSIIVEKLGAKGLIFPKNIFYMGILQSGDATVNANSSTVVLSCA